MEFRCSRCGKDGPRLSRKPVGGRLGQQILDRVCEPCWREWDDLQLKILNEYRLNLSVPQHYDMLVDELRSFLNLKDGATGAASVRIDEGSDRTF